MSQFSDTVKKLRTELNLSMQALADAAGVSKSMISKIERDEVQPTLDVAARLAKAFGKSLSELLHTPKTAQMEFIPRHQQAVWQDAAGIKRRNISPVFEGLKVEWIEVELPKGTSIEKFTPSNYANVAKYVLAKQGILKVIVDDQQFILHEGDSLYFDMNVSHGFYNETEESLIFYVVLKFSEG